MKKKTKQKEKEEEKNRNSSKIDGMNQTLRWTKMETYSSMNQTDVTNISPNYHQ